MGTIWIVVIVIIASYLIGSISMTRIVSRLAAPEVDLDKVEIAIEGVGTHRFRTIGATTASIKLGPRLGGLIGILDILKGLLPVLVLRLVYPDHLYHLIAAVFVVVGHNWSIFHRFTGGAGISPSYGGFFVVDWIGTLVSSVVGMLFGFLVIRDMVIAYLSGPWFMLLWLILFKGDWPHILYGVAINVVLLLSFVPEVREYFKQKRESKVDANLVMQMTPMGRGMKKLMRFLGVDGEKKGGE